MKRAAARSHQGHAYGGPGLLFPNRLDEISTGLAFVLGGRHQRQPDRPVLAQRLGGGPGSTGGDIFFAAITAVAFTTILAVVSGVVPAASGAAAHDVDGAVMRGERRPSPRRSAPAVWPSP